MYAPMAPLRKGALKPHHYYHHYYHRGSPFAHCTTLISHSLCTLYRSHLWHSLPLSSFALSTSLTFCALSRTHLLHSLPLSIFALSTVLTFCTLSRCSAAVISVLTHLSLQPIKANITTTVTTTIVIRQISKSPFVCASCSSNISSQPLTPVAHQRPSS